MATRRSNHQIRERRLDPITKLQTNIDDLRRVAADDAVGAEKKIPRAKVPCALAYLRADAVKSSLEVPSESAASEVK